MEMRNYKEFIDSKRRIVPDTGIRIDGDLNDSAFEWQRRIMRWSLKRGRSAIFAGCGLGKTLMQLVWAENVFKSTQCPVVIHTPVGVRQQTKREAEKFNIDCRVEIVDDPSQVIAGINLVNYEKIHKFDGVEWSGVVLDESSVLKGLNGKTVEMLNARYRDLRFKLACTATPAPNDHMELGNHAEFLGVCDAVDMLNRYFYHDSGDTSRWVLMGHAKKEFWQWVSQWAVCVSKPSDIGGDDAGYELPPLRVQRHIVQTEETQSVPGFLFNVSGISATTLHEEKRMTNIARCEKAAAIANAIDGPVICWCDTNYESDELMKRINGAVEVRGSMKESEKEKYLHGFSRGDYRVMVSKSSIAGFGMNWQHCRTQVFAGLSYSFEQYYQAVRRSWRFGQTMPVDVHIVLADTESAIESAIARKETDFDAMKSGMAEALSEYTLETFGLREGKTVYKSHENFKLPLFIGG